MSVMKTTVYTPVGRATREVHAPAARLAALAGRRIGLLFNNKSNADVMLRRVAELLAARHPDVAFTWVRKPNAGSGMTPDNFNVLRETDAVITGLGD